jgi:hypothetical protein
VDYTYAATDVRPRGAEEEALCASASHIDVLYVGTTAALFAGSIYLDIGPLKESTTPAVRLMGPTLVGVTWGSVIGGGYLAWPKCRTDWAPTTPREGDFRSTAPLAIALAMLSAATAPVIDWFSMGPPHNDWPLLERSERVLFAMGGGFLGALLPYALPPKPWRAFKELQRLRPTGTASGASVSYVVSF